MEFISIEEPRSTLIICRCTYMYIGYHNHSTHTMCAKSNVFSGCSGNLGKLFFPFSGTHLKLFRKECPICLLGDFYKANTRKQVTREVCELLLILLFTEELESPKLSSDTYKTTVLPRFVIVIVCPGNFAAPKTVLAELIRVAFLTSVSEAGEVLFVTRVTRYRMGH